MSIQRYDTKDYTYEIVSEETSLERLAPEMLKNPTWKYNCPCGEILDWKINPPVETFDRREYYEEEGEYVDREKWVCSDCKRDLPRKDAKSLMWSAKVAYPKRCVVNTTYSRTSKKDGSIITLTKEEFEKAIIKESR